MREKKNLHRAISQGVDCCRWRVDAWHEREFLFLLSSEDMMERPGLSHAQAARGIPSPGPKLRIDSLSTLSPCSRGKVIDSCYMETPVSSARISKSRDPYFTKAGWVSPVLTPAVNGCLDKSLSILCRLSCVGTIPAHRTWCPEAADDARVRSYLIRDESGREEKGGKKKRDKKKRPRGLEWRQRARDCEDEGKALHCITLHSL